MSKSIAITVILTEYYLWIFKLFFFIKNGLNISYSIKCEDNFNVKPVKSHVKRVLYWYFNIPQYKNFCQVSTKQSLYISFTSL